jgi:hypothetical protein
VDSPDVQHSGSEATRASPASTSRGVPPDAEEALIQEVRQLSAAHAEALAAARRSKEQALGILLELGKRLSDAKGRLARPGRNGGWSSFARSAGLMRAEADGLVRRYRRTLELQTASAADAAIAAPASGLAETDAGARSEAAEVAAVPGPAIAASQAPVEATTATDETAATPTESGQAAAAADAGSGAVA